jgi:hypothetical protein
MLTLIYTNMHCRNNYILQLTLGDMHFDMRVNHESWVMEPNFGIVHIRPPQHVAAGSHRKGNRHGDDKSDVLAGFGRPSITGELFSKNSHVTSE